MLILFQALQVLWKGSRQLVNSPQLPPRSWMQMLMPAKLTSDTGNTIFVVLIDKESFDILNKIFVRLFLRYLRNKKNIYFYGSFL